MPAIIGLDLSLRSTGYAKIQRDGTIESKAFRTTLVPYSKMRGMERVNAIMKTVTDEMDLYEADGEERHIVLWVIEGYAYGRPNAATKLAELGGVVKHSLWLNECDAILVPPTVLKEFATGYGRATKQRMIDAANEMYPALGFKSSVKSDEDRADAFWCAMLGVSFLGWQDFPYTKAQQNIAHNQKIGI